MKLTKLTFVICMLTAFLSFFGCSNAPKENDISVTELHDLLENDEVLMLDVRTPKEVAEGKIKSTALEADFFEDSFMDTVISKLTKDQTVYVYCKSGRRSGKTVVKLRELGYINAYNIEGGITAWKAAGYAVE